MPFRKWKWASKVDYREGNCVFSLDFCKCSRLEGQHGKCTLVQQGKISKIQTAQIDVLDKRMGEYYFHTVLFLVICLYIM